MTGRDGFPRAGYSTGDSQEMPVDLAAMQADDTLLDILGSGAAPGDASDELTRVLAGWRREVDAEPVGELVDTNTALAVIRAARQPAARSHRRRRPGRRTSHHVAPGAGFRARRTCPCQSER